MKIKHLLITIALTLTPALVSAMYTDQSTGLRFAINSYVNNGVTASGAVVYGSSTPVSGLLTIPATVYDPTIPAYTYTQLGLPAGSPIPVLAISGNAGDSGTSDFMSNTAITGLSLPSSLTMITNYAFSGCTGLTGNLDLSVLPNLTYIGESAFYGCTNLTGNLLLPNNGNLKTIFKNAFYNCKFTNNNIEIPSSVSYIGSYAFNNCTGLTGNLDLSALSELTTIDYGAFSGCTKLTGNLYLPNNAALKTIGYIAFSRCGFTNTNLVIPATVDSIGYSAFSNCTGLKGNLDLSALTNLKRIGGQTFLNCSGLNGILSLPTSGSLKYIDTQAFANCQFTNKDLVIPVSVTSLGGPTPELQHTPTSYNTTGGVFANCSYLTGDLVVEGANTIWGQTFQNCTGLRSITFKSPTLNFFDNSIYDSRTLGGTFYSCYKLEYVDMSACTIGTIPSNIKLLRGTTGVPTSEVFLGIPNHTLVYLPKETPTDLITPDMPNYIYSPDNGDSWTCQYLAIGDGIDHYVPHGFTTTRAIYANNSTDTNPSVYRTFSNNTGKNNSNCYTLYLPYPFTLPAGMTGYALTDYSEYSETFKSAAFIFTAQPAGTVFAAYTPYIARIEGDSTTKQYQLPDAQGIVPATPYAHGDVLNNPNIGATTDGTWKFYGTTEKLDNATATAMQGYHLESNWWHQVTAANTAGYIGQFRCFIAPSNPGASAAKAFVIGFRNVNGNTIGNTATGINPITGNVPSNSVETRIYNISGQYMGKDIDSLPKGLYIVNGKKVIKN